VYGSVDTVTTRLYGFEIEATPAGEAITHPKNYRAAHVVWRAISARSTVLPFRPERGAVYSAAEQLGCEVGNEGEDLFLVPAHLVPAGERPGRMCGGLTPVIKCETLGNAIRVMAIGSVAQSLDQPHGFVIAHWTSGSVSSRFDERQRDQEVPTSHQIVELSGRG